jgi:hypothetical protein
MQSVRPNPIHSNLLWSNPIPKPNIKVRGVTTSLTVDLAYLLEGQRAEELPESLIGAVRFEGIDLSLGVPLDTSRELPMAPWGGGGGGGGGSETGAAATQAQPKPRGGGTRWRGGGVRPEQ